MVENDVIGCIELGFAQGFKRYLVCEKWLKGSKVNNIDACPA